MPHARLVRPLPLAAPVAVLALVGVLAAGAPAALAAPGAAPGVTVVTPTDHQSLFVGQAGVVVHYACSDAVSCVGSAPDGSPVDTSTSGVRTLTVTATAADGSTTTVSRVYRVVPVRADCDAYAASAGVGSAATGPLGSALPQDTCTDTESSPAPTTLPSVPGLPAALRPTVTLSGLHARTTYATTSAGVTETATSEVGSVTITVPLVHLTVVATGLWATSTSSLGSCDDPATPTNQHGIGSLTVNGKKVATSGPGAPDLGLVDLATDDDTDALRLSVGADPETAQTVLTLAYADTFVGCRSFDVPFS